MSQAVSRVRRPSAFSLVEVIFAFAMVAGMVAVLMNFFMGTQRQAVGSETKLNAMLVAQMVVERMRSHATLNPAYFKQLGAGTYTSSGTVVDPAAAANGTGTQLSPFFEHLFVLNGGDLYTPPNRVAMPAPVGPPPADLASNPTEARRRSLVEAFRDFRVDVKVENDVELEPAAPQPALQEMVKKVTVTVSRGSALASKGSDPNAVVLVTRMNVPTESLTDGALLALNNNFEQLDAGTLHDQFFLEVDNNPFFSEDFLGKYYTLLADCYIMLGVVGKERFIVEGGDPGFGQVILDAEAKSLTAWITELSAPELIKNAVFRRQVAKLQRLRASTVFDAFRHLQPILKHLTDGHKELLPKVDALTAMLKDTEKKLIELNEDTLDKMKEYKDAEKRKKDAADALVNSDKLLEAANKLASEAATLKATGEAMLLEADALAASGTASAIVDAKKAEARKKLDEAKKKAEDAKKMREKATQDKEELKATVQAETEAMNAALADLQARMGTFATTLSAQAEELMSRIQTVIVVKFLADFFQNAAYLKLLDERVKKYPKLFGDSITGMYDVLKPQEALPDDATPFERTMNALDLVEAAKIRMLLSDGADTELLAELKTMADKQAPRMRELARYLRENEAHDFAALKARNEQFRAKWQVMKELGSGASVYEEVVKHYRPGGKIREFLDVYTRVTSEIQLNSTSLLAQINRQIQAVRGELAYVGNATIEEILRAMSNVNKNP